MKTKRWHLRVFTASRIFTDGDTISAEDKDELTSLIHHMEFLRITQEGTTVNIMKDHIVAFCFLEAKTPTKKEKEA